MSRPIGRVALYGFLASGNLGNDASLETVLSWLRTAHPDVALCGVSIAPEELTARYQLPARPLAARPPRLGDHRLAQLAAKLLGRALDVPRSLVVAGSADAVVVPGMGVLESTLGTRPWGLPVWLFLTALACRVRGRRFVLLDIGADRAAQPLTRALQVATVRLADHVSYRDPASAAAMVRPGAAVTAVVAPDLAFAHPAPRANAVEPGHLVVGVMAYYGADDDPVAGAGVRQRYVAELSQALAELIGSGSRVTLTGGDGVDTEVAYEVEAAVRAACPGARMDAICVRPATTFTELSALMATAEVVVASRFHNLICALRLNQPTVSVGYAAKNSDLMHSVGLESYCQQIDMLDGPALVAQVRAAARDRESLGAALRRHTSANAEEVGRLLGRVAADDLGLAALPERTPLLEQQPR